MSGNCIERRIVLAQQIYSMYRIVIVSNLSVLVKKSKEVDGFSVFIPTLEHGSRVEPSAGARIRGAEQPEILV